MAQVFGDNGGSVYEQVPSWTADQQRAAWFGGGAQPVPMMQVAPQVQAIQGYANAGAAAAGRTGTPAQTAVNINPVQRAAAAPQMTQPGQSSMMTNPAQAGTAGPVARLETQPSPGLQGRDGVAQQSAQAASSNSLNGMRLEGMSPDGFKIVTPNGNQTMQGAANAGVLPAAGMAQNVYNVKFDKGEYNLDNGTMKLDFSKYGGSTFTGTFAEMNKLGSSGLAKLFGNFHNGAGGNQNGNAAAATADQNRAGVMQQGKPNAMPLPPARPGATKQQPQTQQQQAPQQQQPGAESMVGPGYSPNATSGSGTAPQKLGANMQQNGAGAQQMAGVLNAQQYLAELQSPELATALKMLALG